MAAKILIVLTSVALAYVLPTYSILRRLVDRRDRLHLSTLQVKGTVTFAPGVAGQALGAPDDLEVQADGIFSLISPGRCRLEVTVPEGRSAASVARHGKVFAVGTELPSLTQAVAQACPVIALRSESEYRSREALEAHLKALGVDQKKTSLGRFDGRIVYVVGDPAEGKPQLWVYKDSFLPARILYTGADGTKWDVRYRSFSSPVTGDWFPRILEVWKNGQPALKLTALEANARAKLDEALFQPAAPPAAE